MGWPPPMLFLLLLWTGGSWGETESATLHSVIHIRSLSTPASSTTSKTTREAPSTAGPAIRSLAREIWSRPTPSPSTTEAPLSHESDATTPFTALPSSAASPPPPSASTSGPALPSTSGPEEKDGSSPLDDTPQRSLTIHLTSKERSLRGGDLRDREAGSGLDIGFPSLIEGARVIERSVVNLDPPLKEDSPPDPQDNSIDIPKIFLQEEDQLVDFSLLCESGAPLVDGGRGELGPLLCSPRAAEPCPSGYWCHIGSSKATTFCCPGHPRGVEPCRQAPGPGFGTGSMRRWWWDWSADVCRSFTYTGYGGNQNNFLTEGHCQRACALGPPSDVLIGPQPPPQPLTQANPPPTHTQQVIVIPPKPFAQDGEEAEVSSSGRRRPLPSQKLPLRPTAPTRRSARCLDAQKVAGLGSASSKKWSYDPDSDQCRSFTYLGTQGSTNRFDSVFECNYYCANKRTKMRESPVNYGGRLGGLDPCRLPSDRGEESRDGLSRPQLRWFWDSQQMGCAQFDYLGAGGNTNNFLSEQLCSDTCGPSELAAASACGLPRVVGGGSFSIPRFAWDAQLRQCVPFFYSGCCGNANRFTSLNDCEGVCGGGRRASEPAIGPRLPPAFGTVSSSAFGDPSSPCIAGAPFDGYCSDRGGYVCAPGHFCHIGLSNKDSVCCPNVPGDICDQPLGLGTGGAQLSRFRFDSATGRCESFSYGGRQGNQNNFLTYDRCRQACLDTNVCGLGSPLTQSPGGGPLYCGPGQPARCPNTHFCHLGADTTSSVCCPRSGPNLCDLPPAQGTGQAKLQRWHFDRAEGRCKPLLYFGREGNENNFVTESDCVAQCHKRHQPSGICAVGPAGSRCNTGALQSCPQGEFCHVGPSPETTVCCPSGGGDVCSMGLLTGAGESALPRYYYDRGASACKAFTYTGRGGNENNFLSLLDCRKACPEYDNPCPAGNPPVNPLTGRASFCSGINPTCPSGFWCHVGESRQTSVCCPFPANPCAMPKADGTGQANLPRWFYSPISRTCEAFTYTGKAGNQNNFLGKAECEAACPVLDNPCSQGMPALTPEGNPLLCSTGNPLVCSSGYYCHVGGNSATTLCCPGAGDPCRMPQSEGNGQAVTNRWYFNTDTKTCLSFAYSGRGGNQNNFVSLAECRQRCPEFANPCSTGQPHIGLSGRITQCGATSTVCPTSYWCHVGASLETSVCCPGAGNPCDLPLSAGLGQANLLRVHYDLASQTCKQFQYSGMSGNQNNFLTKQACEKRCPVFRNPCGEGEPARSSVGQLIPCSVAALDSCPPSYWCHVGSDEQSTLCCPSVPGLSLGGRGARPPGSRRTEVSQGSPCLQSLSVGRGSASLPRHYYNSLTQQCLPFLYSGSGGNQNNFLSRADCERTCPVFANPCAAGDPATGPNGQYSLCSATSPSVCPAGYWCHIGEAAGNSVCCPGSENPCLLPLSVGHGGAQLIRWYFDANLRRCTRMTYTGRGGNQNNFLSIQDCQLRCPEFENPCGSGDPGQAPGGGILFCSEAAQTCPTNFWCHIGDTRDSTVCCPGASDPCLQGLVPGLGQSRMRRYYFNQNTRQCLEFTYTGRGGNQNNFRSEAECVGKCPVFRNPCGQPLGSLAVTYCSAQSKDSCPAGSWCHVGMESRDSVCCPGASDPCRLPVSQGTNTGTNPTTRWHFDRQDRQCKQFQYTGIGGNQNNFLTRTECAQKCPEFTNPCFGAAPYKEAVTGLVRFCARHTGAGRSGQSDCPAGYWCHLGATEHSTVCCAGSQDPCTVTVATGNGGAALTRWFFNSATRRCQQFTYSGLGGNQNNFLTQTECQGQCPEQGNPCGEGSPLVSLGGQVTYCSATRPHVCPVNYYCHVGGDAASSVCCPSSAAEPCALPANRGSGTAALRRYAFNSLTKRCEELTYSGAGGNPNNFVTLAACRQKCPEQSNPCGASGRPYTSVGGGVLYCSEASVCPSNHFCHYGADTTTTVCCPSTSADPCIQTVELGSGRRQLDRFYYNQAIRQCVPFVYSGLGGNENNFRSAPECQARCRPQNSPCGGGAAPYMEPTNGRIRRCSSASGSLSECPPQFYCQVGASVFDSACCPVSSASAPRSSPVDRCSLPTDVGVGNNRRSRWAFRSASRTCAIFTFNGLAGNANNFRTKGECEAACLFGAGAGVRKKVQSALCPQGEPQITERGSPVGCRWPDALGQRVTSEQCPNANYVCHLLASGAGNCCPSPRSFCLQPRSIGSCLELGRTEQRWGYNPGTDACQPFKYSGCGGNLNNFPSRQRCQDICSHKGYDRLLLADATEEFHLFDFPLPKAQRKDVVLASDAMGDWDEDARPTNSTEDSSATLASALVKVDRVASLRGDNSTESGEAASKALQSAAEGLRQLFSRILHTRR